MITKRKIRGVAFDFDGTLTDSHIHGPEVIGRHIALQRKAGLALEELSTISQQWPHMSPLLILERFFPDINETALLEAWQEEQRNNPPRLFPEVYNTLAALSRLGMLCFIFTGRDGVSAEEVLRKYNARMFFRAIVGMKEYYPHSKAHAESMERVWDNFSVYGIKPREIMYVSDAPDICLSAAREKGTVLVGLARDGMRGEAFYDAWFRNEHIIDSLEKIFYFL